MVDPNNLVDAWRADWTTALRAWGRYITLRPPELHTSTLAAEARGLTGSFAAFRLDERMVLLDLESIVALDLGHLGVEVMAHEVGHHVLCPADLADHGRLLLRVRRGLHDLSQYAPLIANLYADLLINDRLQRSRGLAMDQVYRRLGTDQKSLLWRLYQRIYEHLWTLPAGTLTTRAADPQLETDAQLGAKLIRVYASDWLAGAGGFAALCLRYLAEDTEEALRRVRGRVCTGVVGDDAHVPGLAGDDDGGEPRHPALDPRVNDFAEDDGDRPRDQVPGELSGGQFREPFEYGQILAQLGVRVDGAEAARRYYRELAMPHLVPFPVRSRPLAAEPLPEGWEQWEISDPVEAVDWLGTTLRSPVVVPGVTTVQRWYGSTEGDDADPLPVDLDLYVDSSGSMPNPAVRLSHLTLAGAILALSALRAGARVQVTLWSGTREFTRTDGFVRDERAILGILTDHIGRGTAFPLHQLRDTYLEGDRAGRPTHIVVISDDGVDTMITAVDERGTPGGDIARAALASAGAGGTLLLRLPRPGDRERIAGLTPGWDLHTVHDWADLVAFAAAFSRRTYERSPS